MMQIRDVQLGRHCSTLAGKNSLMAWFGHASAAAYRLSVELRVLDAKQPHKEGLHAPVWLSLAERFCAG